MLKLKRKNQKKKKSSSIELELSQTVRSVVMRETHHPAQYFFFLFIRNSNKLVTDDHPNFNIKDILPCSILFVFS
jgi:hypothetical protein